MHDTAVEPPPGANRVGHSVLVLAAAAFAASANIRIIDPLLPQLAEEFSTTIAAASVVASAYALAYGAFQLVHGAFGDRFGKVRVITLMTLLAGLTTGLAALAGNLHTLLVLRLLSGAGAAAIIPLSMAHIGDTVPAERRQEVLARYLSGVTLGIIAGQAFGGILGDHLGWRGVFVALSGLFAVITLLLWTKLRVPGQPEATRPLTLASLGQGLVEIGRSPMARVVLATVFVEGMLFYGAFTYIGAFLRTERGLGYSAIGGLLAAFGLGALAYSLLAPVFLRRLGQKVMARVAGVLLAGAFLAFAADAPTAVLAGPILCCGLGFYLIHNTLQTCATQMAPRMRGVAVSIFASFFFLGQSAGVSLAGRLAVAVGYRPVFAGAGVLLLILTLLFSQWIGGIDIRK